MRVGVSGHQKRDGIDWNWTRGAVAEELKKLSDPIESWSSLAVGADQLVAEETLKLNGSIVTVIPGNWYEECYKPEDIGQYLKLLALGKSFNLDQDKGEGAFLAAGMKVAEMADMLFVIWDGKSAKGRGGTGDIVDYALSLNKDIMHIDPINCTVKKMLSNGIPSFSR